MRENKFFINKTNPLDYENEKNYQNSNSHIHHLKYEKRNPLQDCTNHLHSKKSKLFEEKEREKKSFYESVPPSPLSSSFIHTKENHLMTMTESDNDKLDSHRFDTSENSIEDHKQGMLVYIICNSTSFGMIKYEDVVFV